MVHGLGFGVQGAITWFWVYGLRFRVSGLGFMVEGLGFGVEGFALWCRV